MRNLLNKIMLRVGYVPKEELTDEKLNSFLLKKELERRKKDIEHPKIYLNNKECKGILGDGINFYNNNIIRIDLVVTEEVYMQLMNYAVKNGMQFEHKNYY